MFDYRTLTPYRKAIRPVQPQSFPQFVDNELDRLAITTNQIITALRDLDARLTAASL